MACFITGSAEGDARLSASEANSRATKYNELLCWVLTTLEIDDDETLYYLLDNHDELREYWTEHKKVDEARYKKKLEEDRATKLKEDGLAKLTPEERKALGL